MEISRSHIWRTLRVVPIALAIGGAALAATLAQNHPRRVIVRYDDLNLSTASGVEALKQRVGQAAIRVCAGQEGDDPLSARQHLYCVSSAADRALAQVRLPAERTVTPLDAR